MRRRATIVLLLLLAGLAGRAQSPVAAVDGWMATVDEATQHIVLRWRPSATLSTMGYHLCTGTPCTDYDTVFGRLDTTYICMGHSALEAHTYRLHVFDSAYNVSALTPAFGNMVLQADIPPCSTTVQVQWTPYPNPPAGHVDYTLMARCVPVDSAYRPLYTTADSTALRYDYTLPDDATEVWLKVLATDGNGDTAQSNTVGTTRHTADTASHMALVDAVYDSMQGTVSLTLSADTAFAYTLQRCIGDDAWLPLAELHPSTDPCTYTDRALTPNDQPHCYRLEVRDACGMNPRQSDSLCLVVPRPEALAAAIPTVIVARADGANGTFRPQLRGLGDLYELTVYTRHGQQVFHTTDPAEGWTPAEGTPQGTYAYLLHCRFANGDTKTYSGTITLVK